MDPKNEAQIATYHIKDSLRGDRQTKGKQSTSNKEAAHRERPGEGGGGRRVEGISPDMSLSYTIHSSHIAKKGFPLC